MLSQFEAFTESLGADLSGFVIGLVVGLLFGVFAQRSRFCLRSASIELFRGGSGQMLPVWLLAFATAVALTQILMMSGMLDKSRISYINVAGSLSGALLGGALFGIGMILTRGCASRLLVVSASGNARAFLTFILIALVAEESIKGVLAPYRSAVSNFYAIAPSVRDMSLYLPMATGLIVGILLFGMALYLAGRAGLRFSQYITAIGVGLAVVLGWFLTGLHAKVSFDIISVESLSFIGPSVATIESLSNIGSLKPSFDIGMVPGVFVGALIAALLNRQFEVEFFTEDSGFGRYVVGAFLMGFGGVLAVGCSVGAGVTGVSVLSLTAISSLIMMIVFAGLTDRLVNRS